MAFTLEEKELHELVGRIAERHVDKIVRRMWMSVMGLGLIVILQGFYIAYISGTKVQELTGDTAALVILQNARTGDERQLSSISTTLADMQVQLNRIESRVDGK